MIHRLATFFVERPLWANLITVAVIIAGGLFAKDASRTLLPQGAPRRVEVQATLPGASALDVERFVTFRLEESLKGLRGIERVESTTTNGQVRFEIRVNPKLATATEVVDEAKRRFDGIRHRLPKDLLPIQVAEQSWSGQSGGYFRFIVTGFDKGDDKHRRALSVLREALERLPGVFLTESNLEKRNLYIRLNDARLARAGVSAAVVRERISAALLALPIGSIRAGDEDIAIEITRPFVDRLDNLRKLPLLMNRAGAGISVGDVAEILLEEPDETVRHTRDGAPYVDVTLTYEESADVIEVSERVRAFLGQEAKEILPAPLGVEIGHDVSELVAHELGLLKSDGLQGVVLVILVLWFFFGWRVGLLAAMDFPVSYLGAFIVMDYFGVNLNMISLVGLIIVAGVLVDDVVVVAENYSLHRANGLAPSTAAVRSVTDVAKPILGMSVTVMVTFLPFLLLQDAAAFIVKPLPIIVLATMLLSIFGCFCLLPSHLAHMVGSVTLPPERRIITWSRGIYERCLHVLLRHRGLVLVAVLAIIGGAVALLMGPARVSGSLRVGGDVAIFVELESAVSLDAAAEAVAPVEAIVGKLPAELNEHYETSLGRSYFRKQTYHGFKFALVAVNPPGTLVERDQKRARIEALLRPQLEALAAAGGFKRLAILSDANDESVQDVVTVYVSGGDRIELADVLGAIRQATVATEGVRDVFMDESRLQRAFHFVPNETAVLTYGLTVEGIGAQIREHFSKQELVRLRTRGEELDVLIDFAGEDPTRAAQLAKMSVMSERGIAVPLSMLGSWSETEVLRRIEHQDRLRMFRIDVLFDQAQKSSDAVTAAVEKQLEPVRKAFPGYHISVKPDEERAKAATRTKTLLLLCLGLVYLVLTLTLSSLVRPLVVLFAGGFGFVGVVYAFFLHHETFGILAVIGMFGLLAVVVNDSLVMTTALGEALAKPKEQRLEAVAKAAALRFQPFMITSLTTLAGILPLAYGLGGNAGWMQPMVLAMGWGLLFAAILTLFFMPCLVVTMDHAAHWTRTFPGDVWRRLLRRPRRSRPEA
ncbi:MAG: efflux RND transporter permease subunit [Deltaproteobacteria bacterium]|nr:efflux RND transporter permease subunit [Deltaproteobacteria bacterium]